MSNPRRRKSCRSLNLTLLSKQALRNNDVNVNSRIILSIIRYQTSKQFWLFVVTLVLLRPFEKTSFDTTSYWVPCSTRVCHFHLYLKK